MIRRVILEFEHGVSPEAAQAKADAIAMREQGSVYFEVGGEWFRAVYSPTVEASVRTERLAGVSPVMIFNAPPSA